MTIPVDYTASPAFGLTVSFTPAPGYTGAGVAVPIQAIHKMGGLGKKTTLNKFATIDAGAMQGIEQGVPGKVEMTECAGTVSYTATRFAAMLAAMRDPATGYAIPGTFTMVLNDGNIMSVGSAATGWAYMINCSMGELNDSAIETIDLSFSVPGGWVPVIGSIVSATVAVSATPMDLAAITAAARAAYNTAMSTSLTGFHVAAISFTGAATNGAVVNLTVTASIGYQGLGPAFAATVYAGQTETFTPLSTAGIIGSSNRALTLAGTAANTVTVNLLCIP